MPHSVETRFGQVKFLPNGDIDRNPPEPATKPTSSNMLRRLRLPLMLAAAALSAVSCNQPPKEGDNCVREHFDAARATAAAGDPWDIFDSHKTYYEGKIQNGLCVVRDTGSYLP